MCTFFDWFIFVFVGTAALAVCSEAYFSAVAKMGDQALHTLSSRSLGECVCLCDGLLSLSITGFSHNLLHSLQRQNCPLEMPKCSIKLMSKQLY